MLQQLQDRLTLQEERVMALSMSHVCCTTTDEVRAAHKELAALRETLQRAGATDLVRRADNALVDLVCVEHWKQPHHAA